MWNIFALMGCELNLQSITDNMTSVLKWEKEKLYIKGCSVQLTAFSSMLFALSARRLVFVHYNVCLCLVFFVFTICLGYIINPNAINHISLHSDIAWTLKLHGSTIALWKEGFLFLFPFYHNML